MDLKRPLKTSSFSVVESIALEIESLFREIRGLLHGLDLSEKTAIAFAICIFLGCFLPWFSAFKHTQSGIDGFGTVHFGISASVFTLSFKVAKSRIVGKETLSPKRIGLLFMILGSLSTLTCIALLVHFGDLARVLHLVNIRFGFYMILFSGLGISASGLAKFL